MKDIIIRLMISTLDRPDSLGSAADRKELGAATWWDKARLSMARLIKKWG